MTRGTSLVGAALTVFLAVLAAGAQAQTPPAAPAKRTVTRGESLFIDRCMDCHDPPAGEATPSKDDISGWPLNDLVDVMQTGRMVGPAQGLTHTEMVAIAAWLTGQPQPAIPAPAPAAPAKPAG